MEGGAQKNKAGTRQRWISAVCGACLLCLVAVGGEAWRARAVAHRGVERSSPGAVEQRPGINVDLTQYDASELERVLSDIAKLGFAWLRQGFPWKEIEVEPGRYEWERWDAMVEATHRHGLGLIAVVDTFPEWAKRQEKYPLPCEPPCMAQAYGRFVSMLADRYADVIDYYQIWDEPNLSQSWGGGHVSPCGYVTLLEVGHRAVHGADSTAWVLGGGLAPTQASDPDNQNDITYLQGIYAVGGGPYLDILAAKPYGFWSGPEDRRVAPDVLNFSRAVAWREVMRDRGDSQKPIWAVEWGWHVEQGSGEAEVPPWGTDTLAVQQERISEAVRRARQEWPWMGVMCWAEYQPAAAVTSARWGFALVSDDGLRTGLHDVLRIANQASHLGGEPGSQPMDSISEPWNIALLLTLLGLVDLVALIRVAGCGVTLRDLGHWWYSLHPLYHLAGLAVLGVLYVLSSKVEWIIVELVVAALVLWKHPDWAIVGAVLCMPFFYWVKAIGDLCVPPNEIWLVLAAMVQVLCWCRHSRVCRRLRAEVARAQTPIAGRRPETRRFYEWVRTIWGIGWSPLDAAWIAWVVLGATSPKIAPDPELAWHEWRLCMLEPALLYGWLRWRRGGEHAQTEGLTRKVLLAWLASGVAVALIGIVQWVMGTSVTAGVVGRALGPYYSPNHLALYLERLLPVALALAVYGTQRWRKLALVTAAILCVCLYLTFSRGAWLLAVPAALMGLGVFRRRRSSWRAYLGAVGLVALAGASVLCGRQTPLVALREEIRLPVWHSAIEMIRDRPWTGFGLNGFQFVYPKYMRIEAWTEPLLLHPHNMWLDAAVRLGLPGVTALVGLIGCCWYEVRRLSTARDKPAVLRGSGESQLWEAVVVGCFAGMLAGLAHGLVDSGYFLVDLAWSFGLMGAMATVRPRQIRSSRYGDVAPDSDA